MAFLLTFRLDRGQISRLEKEYINIPEGYTAGKQNKILYTGGGFLSRKIVFCSDPGWSVVGVDSLVGKWHFGSAYDWNGTRFFG
jgi:hypothetical protein